MATKNPKTNESTCVADQAHDWRPRGQWVCVCVTCRAVRHVNDAGEVTYYLPVAGPSDGTPLALRGTGRVSSAASEPSERVRALFDQTCQYPADMLCLIEQVVLLSDEDRAAFVRLLGG